MVERIRTVLLEFWQSGFWDDVSAFNVTLRQFTTISISTLLVFLVSLLLLSLANIIVRAIAQPDDEEQWFNPVKYVRRAFLFAIVMVTIGIQIENVPFRGIVDIIVSETVVLVTIGCLIWFCLRSLSAISAGLRKNLQMRLVFQIIYLVFWSIAFVRIGLVWLAWPVGCYPDCQFAELKGRDLAGLTLDNASFAEANLADAQLNDTNLSGSFFQGANLRNANLQNTTIINGNFVGADLRGADLRGSTFDNVDFAGAVLNGADLTGVDLSNNVRFYGAILDNAIMVETIMTGIDFAGNQLIDVDMTGSILNDSALRGAILSGANLSVADLDGAWMDGAIINNVNLSSANITNAQMYGVSFIGSNLASVDLTDSDLRSSILIGANLRGAQVNGTDLTNIQMFPSELNSIVFTIDPSLSSLNSSQRANVLVRTNLSGLLFDSETIWPEDKRELLVSQLGIEPETSITPVGVDALARIDITALAFDNMVAVADFVGDAFIADFPVNTFTIESNSALQGFTELCSGEAQLFFAEAPAEESDYTACAENADELVEIHIGTVALVMIVNSNFTDINTLDIQRQQLQNILTLERWSDLSGLLPNVPIQRFVPAPDTLKYHILTDIIFSDNPSSLQTVSNTEFHETDAALAWNLVNAETGISLVSYAFYLRNQSHFLLVPFDDFELNAITLHESNYPFTQPIYLYTTRNQLRDNPQLEVTIRELIEQRDIVFQGLGVTLLDDEHYDTVLQQLSSSE